jgi:hypothetical protein
MIVKLALKSVAPFVPVAGSAYGFAKTCVRVYKASSPSAAIVLLSEASETSSLASERSELILDHFLANKNPSSDSVSNHLAESFLLRQGRLKWR